jgi:hypothetical protein
VEAKKEKFMNYWKSLPHELVSAPKMVKIEKKEEKKKETSEKTKATSEMKPELGEGETQYLTLHPDNAPFFEMLGDMHDEVPMTIDPSSPPQLKVKMMDASHVCMVEIELSLDYFQPYKLDGEATYILRASDLYKFLRVKNDLKKELHFHADGSVSLSHGGKMVDHRLRENDEAQYGQLARSEDLDDLPPISYNGDVSVAIDPSLFYANLKELSKLPYLSVKLCCGERAFILEAKFSEEKDGCKRSGKHEVVLKYPEGELDWRKDVIELRRREKEASTSYYIPFLLTLTKIHKSCNKMVLSFSKDHPLKIEYEFVHEGCKGYAMLAPRLEEDDDEDYDPDDDHDDFDDLEDDDLDGRMDEGAATTKMEGESPASE